MALPRGVLVGTCFAAFLAVPLFLAISLDAGSHPIPGRMSLMDFNHARPRPVASISEFFDGQIAVHVFVARRPAAGKPTTEETASKATFLGPMTHNETSGVPDAVPMRTTETLQVRLENRSAKDLEIDVLEARSKLGDLAGGLQRVRLAPGQTAQTGLAINGERLLTAELPVQVSMRLGGQQERHELVLPATQLARARD